MPNSCTDEGVDLYLEAARRIAQGEETYSCMAIYRAHSDDELWPKEADEYEFLFSPNSGGSALQFGIYEASREANDGVKNDEWCREFRVLLLCMMAAVAGRP